MINSPRLTLRHRFARIPAFVAKREMNSSMHATRVTAVASSTEQDCDMMHAAISEARIAAQQGEIPVGAVIAKDGREICRAHNLVEQAKDATSHAEMLCLRQASKVLGAWRLQGCTLYVTLEPCPMCAGAILQARVDRVVYGAQNSLLGADGSWVQLFPQLIASDQDQIHAHAGHHELQQTGLRHPFHVSMRVESGVASEQCAELMKAFFRKRRAQSRVQHYHAEATRAPLLEINPLHVYKEDARNVTGIAQGFPIAICDSRLSWRQYIREQKY